MIASSRPLHEYNRRSGNRSSSGSEREIDILVAQIIAVLLLLLCLERVQASAGLGYCIVLNPLQEAMQSDAQSCNALYLSSSF